MLPLGDYRLEVSHRGWLTEHRRFSLSEPVGMLDVGEVFLRAGDADVDDDVDVRDLQLFGQSLDQLPPGLNVGDDPMFDVNEDGVTGLDVGVGPVTDANNDGVFNVLDLAHAAVNFGDVAGITCQPGTPGDSGGPNILGVQTSQHGSNSLIRDFDVLADRPVQFYVDYENPEAGRFRSRTLGDMSLNPQGAIVRLRAVTPYCFQVYGVDGDGLVSAGFPGKFTTGPLSDGLLGARFEVVEGEATYPLTLKEHTDSDFLGLVMLDDDAKVVWYHKDLEGSPSPISQRPNGNLVYINQPIGVKEITPLGDEVARIDQSCIDPGNSRWHHETILRPDGKVLFLGSEIRDASGDLPPGHGSQSSDTIHEWDPVAGTLTELVSLHDLIPQTDRTSKSDFDSGFFWRGCPVVTGVEDWTHSNAIFVGPTGNTIVSMRHIDQDYIHTARIVVERLSISRPPAS